MDRLYYFDLCALVVLFVALESVYFHRMHKGLENRTFLALIFVDIFATVFDILRTVKLPWLPFDGIVFKQIVCTSHFICRAVEGLFYLVFVLVVTGAWKHVISKKHNLLFIFVPAAVNIVLHIVNLFTGNLYYYSQIGSDVIYNRAQMYTIIYIFPVYYVLLAISALFKYRKAVKSFEFAAVFSLFPLNALALLIQLFNPTWMVEMFCISITMLLISIFVLRADVTIDQEVGVQSYNSFCDKMNRIFVLNANAVVAVFSIKNFYSLFSMYEYNVIIKILENISERLASPIGVDKMDLYYLHSGIFTCCFEYENNTDLALQKTNNDKLLDEMNSAIKMISNGFSVDKMDVRIETASCILSVPTDANSVEEVIEMCRNYGNYVSNDKAISLAELPAVKKTEIKHNLDQVILDALNNDRFQMYYQPIYDANTNKFSSCEALIRMFDVDGRMITPDLFIPAAEKSGLIIDVGNFVIDSVFSFISSDSFKKSGLERVGINLSAVQCMQQDLPDIITNYSDKYHVSSDKVYFEITETASDFTRDILLKTMRKIYSRNFNFALDDYGTGYSNLERATAFPFRYIKLDKSIVDRRRNSGTMPNILTNTISSIRSAGISVVVEGIESKEDLQWFIDRKCDFIQGFYFSKPLPFDELMAFLESHK